MNTLRVALAQINPTVGDLEKNTTLVLDYIGRSRKVGADIVAFPELALTGYPPEDLLLKPHFVRENIEALDRIIEAAKDLIVIVGFVDTDGSDIYNAAAVIAGGKLVDAYHKNFLPNYGVFDEERYFQSGTRCPVFSSGDARIGVNICEDIWYPGGPDKAAGTGRRCSSAHQHFFVALPCRQDCRSRANAVHASRRQCGRVGLLQCCRRDKMSLCLTATA